VKREDAAALPRDPPPAGAPWDLPIDEAPLAFLDLEMTGLAIGEDRLVEICVERVRGDALEGRLQTLVDPGGRVGAVHVHGLDAGALAGAPRFAEVAEPTLALLEGAIVVAHGAGWDLAFLRDELLRVGLDSRCPRHALDTLVLARRALYLHSYALGSVATALGTEIGEAHRAAGDVTTLRGIFPHLLAALTPKTPRDLWDVRVGERAPRPGVLATLEAALADRAPVEMVYRPAHGGPQSLIFVVQAIDAPRVHGYTLPARSRRDLRIDRILHVAPLPQPPAR
jgi:DNA polymerase-3 subunit epsilon